MKLMILWQKDAIKCFVLIVVIEGQAVQQAQSSVLVLKLIPLSELKSCKTEILKTKFIAALLF